MNTIVGFSRPAWSSLARIKRGGNCLPLLAMRWQIFNPMCDQYKMLQVTNIQCQCDKYSMLHVTNIQCVTCEILYVACAKLQCYMWQKFNVLHVTNIQCVTCDKYSMCYMWQILNVTCVKYNLQVARRSVSSKVLLKSNQGEREVEALVKVGFTINILKTGLETIFEKTNHDLLWRTPLDLTWRSSPFSSSLGWRKKTRNERPV